jgi:hypothetical protein
MCGDVSPKFPFCERVCPFVRRGSAGQILFEFWHPERRLEFFAQGGQPQSFVDVFDVSHQLLGARRLSEMAFLTWYSVRGGRFADGLDSPTDGPSRPERRSA